MTVDILATVTLKNLSGIPKDDFVNSFAFRSELAVPTGPELDTLATNITRFYDVATANGAKISDYLANTISRAANAHEINFYDITGKLQAAPNAKGNMVPPAHGSPIKTNVFSIGGPGGATALPSEVAVVMTLRARGALVAPVEMADGADAQAKVDRPRQRLSGRLFLGPLTTAALGAQAGDNQVRPQAAMMTTFMQAAERLSDEGVAAPSAWLWCVWSRMNGAMHAVTSVETDNAFDTQRRRGAQPSSRNAQVFAPVPDLALGA